MKFFKSYFAHNMGFTLAEVLITLGIIGIVAALTLPGVIAKSQRKVLHSQLLVGYSLLQQALERMNADYGYPPTPSDFAGRKFKSEYIKYFDNPIDCGWGGVYATSKDSELCGKGQYVTSESGSRSQLMDIYTSYNKAAQISSNPLDDGQFALKNGMLVFVENINSGLIYISIDVNGVTKNPNAWGHDLFTFQLMSDGKLMPMGSEGTKYTDLNTYCSKTSTNAWNGVACTQRALTDKNYWNGI